MEHWVCRIQTFVRKKSKDQIWGQISRDDKSGAQTFLEEYISEALEKKNLGAKTVKFGEHFRQQCSGIKNLQTNVSTALGSKLFEMQNLFSRVNSKRRNLGRKFFRETF